MTATAPSQAIDVALVRDALTSQYRAGLAMLRDAVESCPDTLWTSRTRGEALWQIAYHALFFTDMYLRVRSEDFEPFPGHRTGVQHEDGLPGPDDPRSGMPLLPEPYTKAHVLAYADALSERLEPSLAAIDLAASESGFSWYPIPKLEHQLVNLRHLQHHAGQLALRIRAETGDGVRWVGSGAAVRAAHRRGDTAEP